MAFCIKKDGINWRPLTLSRKHVLLPLTMAALFRGVIVLGTNGQRRSFLIPLFIFLYFPTISHPLRCLTPKALWFSFPYKPLWPGWVWFYWWELAGWSGEEEVPVRASLRSPVILVQASRPLALFTTAWLRFHVSCMWNNMLIHTSARSINSSLIFYFCFTKFLDFVQRIFNWVAILFFLCNADETIRNVF